MEIHHSSVDPLSNNVPCKARGAATSDSQPTVGPHRIKRKAITPASISFLFLLHGTLATGSVFFPPKTTTHWTRPLSSFREERLHFSRRLSGIRTLSNRGTTRYIVIVPSRELIATIKGTRFRGTFDLVTLCYSYKVGGN